MNKNFELNDKTRIIAINDDLLLVTNDEYSTLNALDDNAIVIDNEGNIVSSYAKIGFLTKYDLWEPVNIKYYEFINNINISSKDWFFGLAVADSFSQTLKSISSSIDNYNDVTQLTIDIMLLMIKNNGIINDIDNLRLINICPISIYCIQNKLSKDEVIKIINNISSNDIEKMGCFIYTEFLRKIYYHKNIQEAFNYILEIDYLKYYNKDVISKYKRLLNEEFLNISEIDIKSDNNTISILEAIIYSIINTTSYEESIKCAVNLGYNSDINCAITGSIAGILYGIEDIPVKLIKNLKNIDYIEEICNNFDMTIRKNR